MLADKMTTGQTTKIIPTGTDRGGCRRPVPRSGAGRERSGHVKVLAGAGEFSPPASRDSAGWVEHLRVADLSVGTYSIPAGGSDRQLPHG